MKNKKGIINIALIILLIVFMIAIVEKSFQNDTFFTIAIGQRILENGIETEEKLVWHEGLEFTNSRWLFDVLITIINNKFDFFGIYVFVLIIASLQSLLYYHIIKQISNNKIIAFISTIIIMYIVQVEFTARAQIISFLLFLIEFYCIEKLLESNLKRYFIILSIIPIILVNVHASVFPMYFVFYLPYIAEYIVSMLHLKSGNKLIIEKRNINLLIILIILGIILSFCTPKAVEPYTDMFKAMGGISTTFIAELQPVDITKEASIYIFIVITIALIGFTDTKVKLTDCLYILGFGLMGLYTYRCVFFFYLISSICIIRIIINFCNNYNIKCDFIDKKLKILIMFCLCFVIFLDSINGIILQIRKDYVDTTEYPVNATEYIVNCIDIKNIRIFNGFNYGSYLELKGIPAFIDSRSGIFTPEFNQGTTILEDWLNVTNGAEHYNKIFDKYGITHVLIRSGEIIDKYICYDPKWKVIYQDDLFYLYERVEN